MHRRLSIALGLPPGDPAKAMAADIVANLTERIEKGDIRGGLHLVGCYARPQKTATVVGTVVDAADVPPAIRRRMLACIMLVSNDPKLWRRALGWYADHGNAHERIAACRYLVVHKLGAENAIRSWSAEGMSVREMADLLGPGYSKSTIHRIRQRIEKEGASMYTEAPTLAGTVTDHEARLLEVERQLGLPQGGDKAARDAVERFLQVVEEEGSK